MVKYGYCGVVSIITISFMLFSESYQERLIRKDLYDKLEQNILTMYQLKEADIALAEVINRDLEIMIMHKNKLQCKLDNHKSFVNRHFIPFIKKLLLAVKGTTFVVSTPIAYYGLNWSQNVWNGKGDLTIKAGNFLIKASNWIGTISFDTNLLYNKEKLERILSKNPQFLTIAALSSVAAAISVISGMLFVMGSYNLYNYYPAINASKRKIEARLKRDNRVIGRLKELKAEMGNRYIN